MTLTRSFQSTHPIRGATSPRSPRRLLSIISIHAPHTGCDSDRAQAPEGGAISIHAPHTGCDATPSTTAWKSTNFNPRTPYGVRLKHCSKGLLITPFQSTHPIRGATPITRPRAPLSHISIHAPHTGCDVDFSVNFSDLVISIHAPHTGCDRRRAHGGPKRHDFNPRTPYGVRPAL